MHLTPPLSPTRDRWGLTVTWLVALMLTSCSAGSGPVSPSDQGEPTCSASLDIVIMVGDEALPATLTDTSTTDQFAQMLPLELDLRDPMGQAFAGSLPGDPLQVPERELGLDPSAGGVYYAPDSQTIALYYDDLGHTVPPPGWALLAELTPSGVATLAGTGRRVRVSIDSCP
ncbi:cyclophilin-like fold protein [Occultella aeris]|uniref:Cyclophilin-like domain-containing protein n=1 Tax=Occultella aeris TaxID=2761496 RepID=A0A7M4DG91_9MICO|nr:cyclophilin-like fold protein [Occultella aeris]VZO35934.1 hypothetical protein HALOF300_01137 [Occultella aeris]